MLSVEIKLSETGEPNQQVEIYFDDVGLEYLLDRLTRLRERKTDHYHLMSELWGDGELSGIAQSSDTLLVHHLKLTRL